MSPVAPAAAAMTGTGSNHTWGLGCAAAWGTRSALQIELGNQCRRWSAHQTASNPWDSRRRAAATAASPGGRAAPIAEISRPEEPDVSGIAARVAGALWATKAAGQRFLRAFERFREGGLALLDQPHALDGRRSVEALDHVVDRQGGHGHGGQRLHLDPGPGGGLHRGPQADLPGLGGHLHLDLGAVERKRVAERD